MKNFVYLLILSAVVAGCRVSENTEQHQQDSVAYSEPHRPQLHFSPKEKWMNDPNGMVYHKGEYHLFYQFYPDGMVWGPMHWGHATSKDLMHWTHKPIALYPDSLGLIFSGSAVVDQQNTSGFGTKDKAPLVAIYTYHSQEKEKAGRSDYQTQGIAYSVDNGDTWKKYDGNPVLKNQGVKDFRDPKVFWHESTKKWIMILAVLDHVELWNSSDLKSWSKLSDFGSGYGAHDGVWECPDLFEVNVENESSTKWVMIVSTNPGGPNGGSGTQYFIGNFDGTRFTSDTPQGTTTWLDYGPDDYAGVTWSNAPDGRKIFFGWMSNWAYAQEVPTTPWRSAMTLPRDVVLKRVDNQLVLKSQLSKELNSLVENEKTLSALTVTDSLTVTELNGEKISMSHISGTIDAKDFSIVLSNDLGEELLIGFDSNKSEFFIDRSKSGKLDFSKNYILRSTAKRVSKSPTIEFKMVVDVASVECFFDDGTTLMTAVFFPSKIYSTLGFRSPSPVKVENLTMKELKSIWEQSK